jgi:hypothetical protein
MMIDRTTFDLRMDEHRATTARCDLNDWRRENVVGRQEPRRAAPSRGSRLVTALAAVLLAGVVVISGVGIEAAEARPLPYAFPGDPRDGRPAADLSWAVSDGTRPGLLERLPGEVFVSGTPELMPGTIQSVWAGVPGLYP